MLPKEICLVQKGVPRAILEWYRAQDQWTRDQGIRDQGTSAQGTGPRGDQGTRYQGGPNRHTWTWFMPDFTILHDFPTICLCVRNTGTSPWLGWLACCALPWLGLAWACLACLAYLALDHCSNNTRPPSAAGCCCCSSSRQGRQGRQDRPRPEQAKARHNKQASQAKHCFCYHFQALWAGWLVGIWVFFQNVLKRAPVSYTHLTLPTKA